MPPLWAFFPQRQTTPLQSTVILHLCEILNLPENDIRCQANEAYAFEFLFDLKKKYQFMSRDEIDGEIGEYLVDCGDWILSASDGIFQSCTYDFNGDGIFTLSIGYRKNTMPDDTFLMEFRKSQAAPDDSYYMIRSIKFADADEKFPSYAHSICAYETRNILIFTWLVKNCERPQRNS